MLILETKTAKLSDVNPMDVTVKELVNFVNEIKEGMPKAFELVLKNELFRKPKIKAQCGK